MAPGCTLISDGQETKGAVTLPSPMDAAAWRARHLIYLDESRTHELHAEVSARQDGLALVTTEFPAGSRDPLEALQMEEVLGTPAHVLSRLGELETRLTATGAYWRADAADMQWAKVAPATAAPRLDLRAHEFDLPDGGGRIKLHHFHGRGQDRLFVAMPRKDTAGRHILADLAFEFPRVEHARIDVLHTRLAAPLLQGRLVHEHLDLPKKGFTKLVEPVQYERAFGADWRSTAKRTFEAATRLLLGRGPLLQEPPRGAASARDELMQVLAGAAVRDAAARFLGPTDERQLLSGGEFAIRRFVMMRRRRADHRDQWRLSILEAALLVRWALASGRQPMVDEEGAKLVRMSRIPAG